ncbi:Sigma factor SigB regulation protein RsbQ [Nocardioides dokdonensis FR1436]|uniref:Sigma factor SigB regulation protein RsbQ n=1 Tax=Nocardioides dokdonensis FR1436 TaxID=1300347 RepID=A0A1A9GKT3_9ACTN|nr:alpha/beta hydrolase [Nocardioides dokdonensis]ANH38898.1 Sigma factor SigB regulation protein RsbQ [Nocardioides dokdonensis FR1436]
MSALIRHSVSVSGRPDGPPIVFVHGFGCDKNMWRHVAPAFEAEHRVVLMDLMGAGGSDLATYDPERYSTLEGYAADVTEVVRELDLRDAVLVGHSVSAMLVAMTQLAEPERVKALVMVAPSPRYTDTADYTGGFAEEDIDELLESLGSNYLGWSAAMAPAIMGNAERPELGEELTETFCRMDPAIARRFATATFRSDSRDLLPRISAPTLVLQCTNDVIAPISVGEYVAEQVPAGSLVLLEATGHCPNLSAPTQTTAAIDSFVRGLDVVPA